MAKVKVEFIESYIHEIDDGGSYIWNDNHGELIRCKDCAFYKSSSGFKETCDKGIILLSDPDDYCSRAERK